MDALPLELGALIISFLPDDATRRMLRLASRQWFTQIGYHDFVFNFTTEEQVPQILTGFNNTHPRSGLVFAAQNVV